jgi:hypothetical protein
LQRQLIAALNDKGMSFIADVVAHSNVELKGGELSFTVANRADKMAVESDVPKVTAQVVGRSVKVTAKIGTLTAAPEQAVPRPSAKVEGDAAVTDRALAHPEVKRFTELFPEAHVRTVRDLKNT